MYLNQKTNLIPSLTFIIALLISSPQLAMDGQLFEALQKKDITKLKRALKTQGIQVNARHGADANTPLHLAAQKLFTQGVSALVEAGADVNALNRMGGTPLCMVLSIGMIKMEAANTIGRILLGAGAHINLPSMSKSLAMHDHPLFEDYIYARCITSIEESDTQRLRRLLAQGADPNHFIINTHGNCPLRSAYGVKVPGLLNIATSYQRVEAACLLLDAGADPAKSSFLKEPSFSRGYQPSISTPICVLALSEGSPEMAQLLFTHVSRSTIRHQWNTNGLMLLACFKREMPNLCRDLHLLLCHYFVKAKALEAQLSIAQKMCEQAKPYMAWVEQSAILDASNLPTYYPLWREQISRAIQTRPKLLQATSTREEQIAKV